MQRLIEPEAIRERVADLGNTISQEYLGRPLTVLGVLTGSIVFLSDLIREITLPHRVGLIQASSYRGRTTTPGELSVSTELLPDIAGRDILLIDDIFDTGKTLERLLETISRSRPNSIRSAVLLEKAGRSQVDIRPDYVCFGIPDEFVVGYGLDYNDDYRHLPFIAVLESADLDSMQ